MRKIDMAAFPPLNSRVPSDYHPANLAAKADDLPTRSGVHGLTVVYEAWSLIENTVGALKDQKKAEGFVSNTLAKALKESEAVLKHLASYEKDTNENIAKTFGAMRNNYGGELRAHFKGKLTEMLSNIENRDVARALWDAPAVLLGLSEEQHAILQDRLAATHATDYYTTRARARAAHELLDRARERFNSVQMKRLAALSSSDDAILAKAVAQTKVEAS